MISNDQQLEQRNNEPIAEQYLKEYTDASTLHGVKYIGQTRIHIIERVYWVVVLCIFFAICGLQIAQVYNRWRDSPVIMSFSHRPTHIASVPLPAVTICPETRIKRSVKDLTPPAIATMARQLNGTAPLNPDDQLLVESIALQCRHKRPKPEFFFKSNFIPTTKHLNLLQDTITPDIDDVLMRCGLEGNEVQCSDIFKLTLTQYGYCFTFNMLEENELYEAGMRVNKGERGKIVRKSTWSLEGGYKSKLFDKNEYPFRSTFYANRFSGLSVLMHMPTSEMQETCSNSLDARDFRVTIQPPLEYPDLFFRNLVRAVTGQDTAIVLRPNYITPAESLRDLNVSRKKCYFEGEKNLILFGNYTKFNCLLECENNLFIKYCGCSLFYYPLPENAKINYCSTAIMANPDLCGSEFMKAYNYHFNVEKMETLEKTGDPISCECLPSCYELIYEYDVTSAPLPALAMNLSREKNATLSALFVYFDTDTYYSQKRTELYATADFVSSCGGLLSLFSGFSFVTIAELIYFLTLRLICRARDKQKLSSNENLQA